MYEWIKSWYELKLNEWLSFASDDIEKVLWKFANSERKANPDDGFIFV